MTVHPTMRRTVTYRPIPARILARQREFVRVSRLRLVASGASIAAHSVHVWSGPSTFNGEPIVVLASGIAYPNSGTNPKTGPMLQLYILPAEGDPHERARDGDDASVCGSCVHRPGAGSRGDCYVATQWGPRNLLGAWRRGIVPPAPPGLFRWSYTRLGAWGDPAMVPLEVLRPIVDEAELVVGYTQRWKDLDAADWGFLMASVETREDMHRAHTRGWRTFRTLYGRDAPTGHERECHATADHVSCIACGGCFGRAQRSSYFVRAHGHRYGRRRSDVVQP